MLCFSADHNLTMTIADNIWPLVKILICRRVFSNKKRGCVQSGKKQYSMFFLLLAITLWTLKLFIPGWWYVSRLQVAVFCSVIPYYQKCPHISSCFRIWAKELEKTPMCSDKGNIHLTPSYQTWSSDCFSEPGEVIWLQSLHRSSG